MNYRIPVFKTSSSRLSELDFDKISFGRLFSDHMFVADYNGEKWTNIRVEPFGRFTMHPASMVLHYGQAIFEGMKAFKNKDGQPILFRPEMHAKRIVASAKRMCMPEFPEDLFLEALQTLIGLDHNWIPPREESSLYVRPYMFATDEFIGVRPSKTYKFIIFTGPVGPYYARPVRLKAETEYIRAAKGGTGEAKFAGNYAASLLPAEKTKAAGFDQVMWLDGKEFRYIQEVGTMNIFFVVDGKVLTPPTDGTILKGITRDSVITILQDKGYTVEEKPVDIHELIAAQEAGTLQEAFGTGTAAVIAPVSQIAYGEKLIELPAITDESIAMQAKREINDLRSGKIEDKRGWIVPIEVPSKVLNF